MSHKVKSILVRLQICELKFHMKGLVFSLHLEARKFLEIINWHNKKTIRVDRAENAKHMLTW